MNTTMETWIKPSIFHIAYCNQRAEKWYTKKEKNITFEATLKLCGNHIYTFCQNILLYMTLLIYNYYIFYQQCFPFPDEVFGSSGFNVVNWRPANSLRRRTQIFLGRRLWLCIWWFLAQQASKGMVPGMLLFKHPSDMLLRWHPSHLPYP